MKKKGFNVIYTQRSYKDRGIMFLVPRNKISYRCRKKGSFSCVIMSNLDKTKVSSNFTSIECEKPFENEIGR